VRPRLIRAALLALVLAHLGAASATGHPANVAHARISIADAEVRIALSLNLFELDLLLALDRDLNGRVDAHELEARRGEIGDYLRRVVGVSAAGRDVVGRLVALEPGRSSDGRAVVDATLLFRSERPLDDVTVRCAPLTELGADHATLARIETKGQIREFVFRRGAIYREAPGALGTALQFLKLGMAHIVVGYDHIAFLLALLLSGASIAAVVKIVTAFTAAHSLTLAVAVLDIVTLDPRLVEAGIALSIVYVAAENLVTARRAGRWLVSFLFGLVHGFGFAEALKELALPPAALTTSLVAFNFGVEIAQVAIVAAAVPLLAALTRTRLHVPVTRLASMTLVAIGLVWLYQRTLA
jgi:hydrogenase/urease accessory protein HupE